MKDIAINIALFIVALMIIVMATWYVSPQSKLDGTNSAEDYSVISDRTILDYVVWEDIFGSIVNYAYLGELLPEKLSEDEVVRMRTSTSFTRQVGIENEGTEDAEVSLETVSYAQQAFIQRDNVWYYIEYSQAPQNVFKKETKKSLLSRLLGDVAEAVTIYAGSGDGLTSLGSTVSWATVHDATSASTATTIGTTLSAGVNISTYKETTTWSVTRAYLPFVTSSIPSNATVTSASLVVNVSVIVDADNDGTDYATVVQTSQATHTALVMADYDNLTATEGIATGQRKDLTGISAGALSFTLNATGLSWIKKSGEASNCSASTGISCFGLREGHDNTNVASTAQNTLIIYASEQAGTSQDPYLSIAYTVPAPFGLWMFSDF